MRAETARLAVVPEAMLDGQASSLRLEASGLGTAMSKPTCTTVTSWMCCPHCRMNR
jgi:hypothetical protein